LDKTICLADCNYRRQRPGSYRGLDRGGFREARRQNGRRVVPENWNNGKTLGPEYLALLDGFDDIAKDDQLGEEPATTVAWSARKVWLHTSDRTMSAVTVTVL